jgi:type IV fimbrial biogenesis protein FimT
MMRKERAFTLIELLITIAIMAVLVTLATPSLQALIRNNRITGQANELVAGLMLGRSEAVKRGVSVTLCGSADGSSCAGDGNWEQGWMVFSDVAADGVVQAGTGACLATEDCILRTQEPLPTNFSLRSGATFSNWLSYSPTGTVRGSGGTGTDTFRLCPDNAVIDDARGIVIAITGRVKVEKGGVASCP